MQLNPGANYYQILQVRFDAEKDDIISSYKRLCKLYHPDISRVPHAQELMAQLNVAYDTLCDDKKRQAYNNSNFPGLAHTAQDSTEQAAKAINSYFNCLIAGQNEQAYYLLCHNDQQHVSLAAFLEWRTAVQELYGIRKFSMRPGPHMASFTLEKNRTVPAQQFLINVVEKDYATGRMEQYSFAKYIVFEQGRPGVYLGYRDLSEISKNIGSQAREREKSLMRQHWQEHLQQTDRITGLLSREGILTKAKTELYRSQRYKRQMTVACLSLKPHQQLTQLQLEQSMEAAAQAAQRSLRLTDTAAYLGNGVFVFLLAELKKRHADMIIERLLQKMAQAARQNAKCSFQMQFAQEQYHRGPLEQYMQRLQAQLRNR